MPSILQPSAVRRADWMSAAELQSRCAAAARLAMRGASYSPEDRAECAASIMATLVERHAPTPERDFSAPLGERPQGVAEVRAMLRRVDNLLRSDLDFLRTRASLDFLRSDVTFTRLSGMAANYRRSVDRTRAREEQDAAHAAASADFLPRVADPVAELATLHPDAAHRAARTALGALGLPKLGRAYPVAYCAVRGLPERSALAELNIGSSALTAAAARTAVSKAMRRARAAVPSLERFTFGQHLAAIGEWDTGGVARKASGTRTHSADLDTRDRTSQDAALRAGIISPEVTASKTRKLSAAQVAASVRRSAERAPIGEVGPHAPRHWREELTDIQRARLLRATELRRARADTGDAAERDRCAAPAGLPYAVR